MKGIIIVAHNELSKSLIDTAQMIYGEAKNIEAISFVNGEGLEILQNKILNSLKNIDTEDGCLVLLDVFGGTPMNASVLALGNRDDVEFVYGVNIPMLLEVLAARENVDIKGLADIALEAGKNNIGTVRNIKR